MPEANRPPESDFREAMCDALASSPRSISPKYLYDERGSEIFDLECQSADYYLPHAERTIFTHHVDEIVGCLPDQATLIEPGSGASKKVRWLLDHHDFERYMAIDISEDFLHRSAELLSKDYPEVEVESIAGDFTEFDSLPLDDRDGQERVLFFPGSTIGNFSAGEARHLLGMFKDAVGEGGHLLVGVDLHKDEDVLQRAYDDDAGLGASFHLNLLHRANRELGGDFQVDHFSYLTFYNPRARRMEMYLLSKCDQTVEVAGRRFEFRAGELMRTQYSQKYSIADFEQCALDAGLKLRDYWTDDRDYYSVQLYRTA